jgi:hypothetical protein
MDAAERIPWGKWRTQVTLCFRFFGDWWLVKLIANGIIREPVPNIFNAGRPDAAGIYDNQRQMATTSYNVAELSIDDHDIPELREFFDEVVKSVMLLLSPTSVW